MEESKSLFDALPREFQDWLVMLEDDLDAIGRVIRWEYPASADELRRHGHEAGDWAETLRTTSHETSHIGVEGLSDDGAPL